MPLLVAVLMVNLPHLSFASMQEDTAADLVRTYGVLDEKDHPLVPAARKIFSRVLAAADKRGSRYPKLLILRRTGGPLAQALGDGTVVLTQKCMEICFRDADEETGSARLAFIFGHELAHLAKDDDWHRTAIRAIQHFEADSKAGQEIFSLIGKTEDTGNTDQDKAIRRKKELQADAHGLLYAAMAAYDYRAVADESGRNFFCDLLEHSPPTENSPYPSAEERAAILLAYVRDIRDDLDIFHFGVRLCQLEKYEDALDFLMVFRKKFPCREVFSNIGLVHYQMAIRYLAACDRHRAYQYKLAAQLDTETRAETFVPRKDQKIEECPEMRLFRQELNLAIQHFRIACDKDASYVPVRVNLSSAYIMAGKYSNAMAILDEALSLSPDDPEALNNKAVSMYRIGPFINVDMFGQAADMLKTLIRKHPEFPDALYNLGRMQSERSRNSSEETWKQYLARESSGLYTDIVREELGIKAPKKAGLTQARHIFTWPPPVTIGALNSKKMNQLKELVKHPLEDMFGEYYVGRGGVRVLVLEDVVELAECPVRQPISVSEVSSVYGEPCRILKNASGIRTLFYNKFALDIVDGMVTKVAYF